VWISSKPGHGRNAGIEDLPNELFLAHRDASKNRWPESPAAFQDTISAYNDAAEKLSLVLLRILALAAGRPEEEYVAQAGITESFLKLFSFPSPASGTGHQGQYRLAAHHDYSAVSIIRCPQHPNGLQVLSSTNEWADVYPDEDGLVVLVGEQMTRWTDGALPASWHRVENPQPHHIGDGRRTSTCYFFNPECMGGDVEGYLEGRGEFAEACAMHLQGGSVERTEWGSPARRL